MRVAGPWEEVTRQVKVRREPASMFTSRPPRISTLRLPGGDCGCGGDCGGGCGGDSDGSGNDCGVGGGGCDCGDDGGSGDDYGGRGAFFPSLSQFF